MNDDEFNNNPMGPGSPRGPGGAAPVWNEAPRESPAAKPERRPPPPPMPPQAPPSWGNPTAAVVSAPATSPLAIASLALGVAGFIVLPVIGALAAIVLGVMARKQIDRDANLGGRGLATAGLVLGVIELCLVALWILLLIIVAIAGQGHT